MDFDIVTPVRGQTFTSINTSCPPQQPQLTSSISPLDEPRQNLARRASWYNAVSPTLARIRTQRDKESRAKFFKLKDAMQVQQVKLSNLNTSYLLDRHCIRALCSGLASVVVALRALMPRLCLEELSASVAWKQTKSTKLCARKC